MAQIVEVPGLVEVRLSLYGHRPGTVLTLRDEEFDRLLISDPKLEAGR